MSTLAHFIVGFFLACLFVVALMILGAAASINYFVPTPTTTSTTVAVQTCRIGPCVTP
jgi:hypothetical protein